MPEAHEIDLKLPYHSQDQKDIFEHPAKYKVVRCGRRYGKTTGGATRLNAIALEEKTTHLWVDTTQNNIVRYVEEIFEPLLTMEGKIPKTLYKWNKQQKILKFYNGSQCVFASAERPQNMEGFAYDYIWLNEAGLILMAKPRMWNTSIRPMTIEGKGAKVCFIGTPKMGSYIYEEISEKARSAEWEPGKHEWIEFVRSSYQNPMLTKENIDELVKETRPEEVNSEIFALFVKDNAGYVVIPYAIARAAMSCETPLTKGYRVKWGVDVAGAGADRSTLAKRCRNHLLEPVEVWQNTDERDFAAILRDKYDDEKPENRPSRIYVDGNGIGKSVYNYLSDWGLPARCVMVQESPHDERYFQKRDELWFRARAWFEEGGVVLPDDFDLLKELTTPLYDPNFGRGKTKVYSKKEMRKLGSQSPDKADAFCLTFTDGADRLDPALMSKYSRNRPVHSGATWMSY